MHKLEPESQTYLDLYDNALLQNVRVPLVPAPNKITEKRKDLRI